MEKKFYTDDFERLLKEKSDEFRMYPSTRVWHSIYNDLHPGRKWPSIAMSMLLVVTLLLIGSLNTNDSSVNRPVAVVSLISNNHTKTTEDILPGNTGNAPGNSLIAADQLNSRANEKNNPANSTTIASNYRLVESMDAYIRTNQLFADIDQINKPNEGRSVNALSPETNVAFMQNTVIQVPEEKTITAVEENKIPAVAAVNENLTLKKNNTSLAILTKKPEYTEDKAWMEDYALHNKGQRNKWKDRVAMEIYVTPAIGYRTQSSNIKNEAATASYSAPTNAIDKTISQKPSLNLEAGVDLAYSFAKNLHLKTGVQLNYTSYGVNADQTNHPILTTLMLNDSYTGRPYLTTRTSTLANSSGLQSVTVHNTTYQVSIPVGLAVKLAGNNKMEWHAGASIQPSFIFGGSTNFISSDYRSYVSDPSLLRRWNMNTGIETYINYKMNGYTLQVGPQFRYQLLSTYTKKYTVNENLYNMGLKVGLVKNF